jgi:hypothetical protein
MTPPRVAHPASVKPERVPVLRVPPKCYREFDLSTS